MILIPYIPPEVVAEAQRMDVLTYLQNYEPSELVRIGNNTYTTKTHDSIRISNGLWNWFSRGIGGKSAISYLMKVKDYTFQNAVECIVGNIKEQQPVIYSQKENKVQNEFILPQRYYNSDRAKDYLSGRGIDKNIIKECINNNLIYEEKTNHNVVFVGYDKNKIPKYAFCRATNDTRFMRDSKGSDKNYTFRLEAKVPNNRVHFFESAIDLLSYATLLKLKNIDWHKENMISLGGVYQSTKIIENAKMPSNIQRYLEENPNINEIYLHLDNDEVGRNAAQTLGAVLSKKYKVFDRPPPVGKDCNDYLRYVLGFRNFYKNTKEKMYQRENVK